METIKLGKSRVPKVQQLAIKTYSSQKYQGSGRKPQGNQAEVVWAEKRISQVSLNKNKGNIVIGSPGQ